MRKTIMTAREAHKETLNKTQSFERVLKKIESRIKMVITNYGGFVIDVTIPHIYLHQVRTHLQELGYVVTVSSDLDTLYGTVDIKIEW